MRFVRVGVGRVATIARVLALTALATSLSSCSLRAVVNQPPVLPQQTDANLLLTPDGATAQRIADQGGACGVIDPAHLSPAARNTISSGIRQTFFEVYLPTTVNDQDLAITYIGNRYHGPGDYAVSLPINASAPAEGFLVVGDQAAALQPVKPSSSSPSPSPSPSPSAPASPAASASPSAAAPTGQLFAAVSGSSLHVAADERSGTVSLQLAPAHVEGGAVRLDGAPTQRLSGSFACVDRQ